VRRFGLSRITIGPALRELERRGLIDRVAGSGTYLRDVSADTCKGLLFGLIVPNLGETAIFEPICHDIVAPRRRVKSGERRYSAFTAMPMIDVGGHGSK
jgi:hypothetical protein